MPSKPEENDRPNMKSRRGRRPSTVSLRQVAQEAGVGLGTASRALNGDFNIRAETLAKVQEATRRLGYTLPNPERRPLPAGSGRIVQKVLKTGRVAFLIPDRTPEGLSTLMSRKLMEGVQGYFFDRKVTLIPTTLNADGSLPSCLADREVDGFIIRGSLESEAFTDKARDQLQFFPRVGVMWSGRDYPMDTVLPDAERSGRLAARMLVERGRRRLVCLNIAHQRRDLARGCFGFVHEAQLLGVQVAEITRPQLVEGRADHLSEFEAMVEELRGLPFRADGIHFVSGNPVLVPMLARMRITPGKARDFSTVVSCREAAAAYRELSLLMVNQHVEQVGYAAAEQLLWRIQHPRASLRKVLIEPEVVS